MAAVGAGALGLNRPYRNQADPTGRFACCHTLRYETDDCSPSPGGTVRPRFAYPYDAMQLSIDTGRR